MGNLTSSLTIKLLDEVSKPAKTVAAALKEAEANAKNMAKAMSGTGATDRLVRDLSKLKLSARDIESVAKAWRDYAKNAGLAANSSAWTKAQQTNVRTWEANTIRALRHVKAEENAYARSQARARALAAAGPGGGIGGVMTAGGVVAAGGWRAKALRARAIAAEQASGLSAYALPAGAGLAGAAAIGVPATAALSVGGLSVKEAMSRETAMASVRKKVDLADGQTFTDIEAIARRVSRDRGMKFSDSAALLAQGGQSGIASRDLERFATLAAKVSSGWDIPAQQAAQSLAEVKAATGWTIPQLERFADRVNKAGDISAAAEKDIASMFQRASAGAQASGVSFNDSMDALTALRSTGMQEEVASRFFGQFSARLRTATTQSKDAQAAFQELGLSAQGLEKGMKTDAVGTMVDFLDRLGKSKDPTKIAKAVGGDQWFDEILLFKAAVAEWKRIRGELTDQKVAGSLDNAIKIDSSTTESALERLKQSAADFLATMAKPAVPAWRSLFDGVAGGINSAREALENYRKSAAKPLEAPKGRSVADYERALKIGGPTKVSADELNKALPFAGKDDLARFDPAKLFRPSEKSKKNALETLRRRAKIPTFAGGGDRPESAILEPPPRALPKVAPLPPRRPQMAPVTDRAPVMGGSVPAFASGSGVTPRVDASQVESVAQKAGAAKEALEGLNITVSPTVDASSISSALPTFVAVGGQMKEAVSFSAAPHVDASQAVAALNSITTAANAARNAINGAINAAANAPKQTSAAVRLPTFAQTNRGSYSAGGDPAGK